MESKEGVPERAAGQDTAVPVADEPENPRHIRRHFAIFNEAGKKPANPLFAGFCFSWLVAVAVSLLPGGVKRVSFYIPVPQIAHLPDPPACIRE